MTTVLRDSRPHRAPILALVASVITLSTPMTASAVVIEWSPANNPYVLTSDVVIGSGDVLRILPGTEIRLDPEVTLWIVGGRLEAIGTEADSILFTQNQPDTYWGAVAFQSSWGNEVRYATFEYSSTEPSLSPLYGGAIYLDDASSANVSNSEFRHTDFGGLYAEGYSQLFIQDCHLHSIGGVGIHTKWGASARVERCVIHNCGWDPPYRQSARSIWGDAIEFTGDAPDAQFHEIRDCLIYDIADNGIDFDLDIDGIVTNTVIYDCVDKGISVAMGSRGVVTNCLIYDCYWALGPQSGGVLDLANCTVYGCVYGLRAIIDDAGWPGAVANVTNLIVWNTSASSVLEDEASTVNASYCNFEDPYPGTGNISADPLFVDPVGGDFHVQELSPCIDAGFSGWPAPAVDLDGNPRVDDPEVPNTGGGSIDYYDMGIDEYFGNVVGTPGADAVSGVGLRAFPNPALAAHARVRVHLDAPRAVTVRLFDGAGRLVGERASALLPAGDHVLSLPQPTTNGHTLAPGVYFLEIDGAGLREHTKIILR